MRLENNFVQVENNPAVINKVNGVAAVFGWTVQSIQITDTAVAYESGSVGWTTEFGTIVNSTITVNRTTYASITYQRDMDDPKYKEWVAFENEYNALERKSFFTTEEISQLSEIKTAVGRKWSAGIVIPGIMFTAMMAMPAIITIATGQKWDGICTAFAAAAALLLVGIVLCLKFLKDEAVTNMLPKDKKYTVLCANERMRKDMAKQEVLNRARMIQ